MCANQLKTSQVTLSPIFTPLSLKMTSELQKQIFRENKAKKMPLKHFCRPRPHFLSVLQNSFFY